VVISHRDKDFFYIFKTEDKVMYGYKIKRFLSFMNSFSEFDSSQIHEFTEDNIENERYICDRTNRNVLSYKVLGRVVAMKDSEIKLIMPVL
jgi:hypothetical protein